MDYANVLIGCVLLAALFSVVFFGYSFALNNMNAGNGSFMHSDAAYNQFVSAELDDVCAVPDGYSQEAWETHMSHHPDRYGSCTQ